MKKSEAIQKATELREQMLNKNMENIPSHASLKKYFLSQKNERVSSAKKIEEFLNFPQGTFDHIPHYAREEALASLKYVRDLERKHLFRPGIYYIVLADLCNATKASELLGPELSKKRIETFILTCVEGLGRIESKNYKLFLREIGDAVLILFSSFYDIYDWWNTTQSWLLGRNEMWISEANLNAVKAKLFKLKSRTIVHVGEVDYSGHNIPLSFAINQVFKIEKHFEGYELGLSDQALKCAKPIMKTIDIKPKYRKTVQISSSEEMKIYLASTFERKR